MAIDDGKSELEIAEQVFEERMAIAMEAVTGLAPHLAVIAKARAAETKEEDDEKREKREAAKYRDEHPAEFLSDADVNAIAARLNQAVYSNLAIYRLAIEALDSAPEAEHFLMAIQEMARANARGIDSCANRLMGDSQKYFAGVFETEFDTAN